MKHARSDYDRIQDPAGKIPEDEPVFLIRGQDLVAAEALRQYAIAAHRAGASNDLIVSVLDQAREIQQWQRVCACKTPDLSEALDAMKGGGDDG